MNKSIAVSIPVLVLLAYAECASCQDSSFSSSVALTSDYVFRGISQSAEGTALQAGTTYTHASGTYLGLWGSQVDFGDAIDADVEIDTFIGYRATFADDWTWDAQLIRYMYPGTTEGVDLDFNELVGVVTYRNRYKLTIGWSPDVFNTSEAGTFLAAGASLSLPRDAVLDLTVGQYRFDDGVFGADSSRYRFWSAGISRSFGRASVSIARVGTDAEAGELFGSSFAGSRWSAALTVSF